MESNQLLKFFQLQRQIFGVCPHTGNLFRLSECSLYIKKKPELDWLQKIELSQRRIDKVVELYNERERQIIDEAKQKGRKEAEKAIRKIDGVFHPKKMNADDSKVIFHPIDYIVFNGMKSGEMKNICMIDSNKKEAIDKQIQRSIEKTIERGHFEWLTLRIKEDGSIKEE
ncbi:MAG TPA: Holliday junction resolvase-like protein [Flavisolibacter sp.]|jgi:predicted Holliday junction resolvase-like endonuclease|nr:Holliday junction resolvase-like protein [Flavisolibacter sp.]